MSPDEPLGKEEPNDGIASEQLVPPAVEHSDIPDISVPPIAKQYLKEVKQLIPGGNRYYFSDGISDVEIKVVSDEIIRVRMAPQGEFLDEFSYAISDHKFQISRIETSETTEHFVITTNTISCLVRKIDFHISFTDIHNIVINEDAQPM